MMKPTLLFLALLLTQLQAPGGSIEGYVTRLGTGQPIPQASVQVMSGSRQPLATATTDDGGRFRFSSVPPGAYFISASHSGHLRSEYGSGGTNRPGSAVTLRDGQEIRDIAITLTPTGALSGRVLTPAGDAVRNAAVQLMNYAYLDGRRMLMVHSQTRTNDLGEYRFESLRPGQYVVSAIVDGGIPAYFPGTPDADAAAPVDLLPAADYRGIDVSVSRQNPLRIRGNVTNDSAGYLPSSVFVILSPRGLRTAIAGSTAPRVMRLGPDGSFELAGLAPGSYELIAMLGDGPARLSARAPVEVGYEDVEKVVLALQPSFNIPGRVFMEGIPAGAGDLNLSRVRVRLVHEPYLPQVAPPPAPVKPDGTFILSGTIPGDFRVRVETDFDSYVKSARLGAADPLNTAVRIGNDAGQQLEIRLDLKVGSLAAVVLDEKRVPVSGAQVVLVPEPPKRDRLDLYHTLRADPVSGRVHIKGIEPGEYKLFAWPHLETGAYQNLDFIRRYEDLGTRVRIGEGASDTAELQLIVAQR